MKVVNLSQNKTIATEVCVARSFVQKTIGLIGTKHLDTQKGLIINSCNWIHTFFMSIPIDVIYLDKNKVVKKIDSNLKPWRLPAPVFSSSSVIELAAGAAQQVKIGDRLHVGD